MEPDSTNKSSETGHREPYETEQYTTVQMGPARLNLEMKSPPGTRMRVTLEAQQSDGAIEKQTLILGETPQNAGSPWERLLAWRQGLTIDEILFGLAVLVYLISRLIRLADFPIYFFTDEAIQTVLAQDFIRDGLRGYEGQFLPTFFQNSRLYNLGVSVYLQVLPYLMFGKSVVVTRGVSVLVTSLAAVWVGLTLRQAFLDRFPWLGVLALSVTPAWFLHSRTAFETVLATTFYAGFLYYYLRYRTGTPQKLYLAVFMAALTFYSYNPARAVIAATAAALLALDWRYHWQQRQVVLKALILTLVAAVPLLRFEITHPGTAEQQLAQLNSYWTQPLPLAEKVQRYGQEYLRGLDPRFWYLQDNQFIQGRHVMDNYGHLPRALLPVLLLGILRALKHIRSAPYRTVLVAALAAPVGAALVEIGITRAMTMVIPAALLTALGFSAILAWVERRWSVSGRPLAVAAFVGLAGLNIWMTWDALENGSTWSTNYGMGGMQYGARQVFAEIEDILEEDPDQKIIVSPNWANGADIVARFFFDDPLPFEIASIDSYITEYRPLDDRPLLVMTPWEVDKAVECGKFATLEVTRTLFYPNEQPGFFFIHPQYVENIEEIFTVELAARRATRMGTVSLAGAPVVVRYSALDMGEIENVFDGDPNTLIRTYEANPLQLEVGFPQTRPISGLDLRIGGEPTELTISLLDEVGELLLEFQSEIAENPEPRTVSVDFEQIVETSSLKVLVRNMNNAEPAHVHLWELTLK